MHSTKTTADRTQWALRGTLLFLAVAMLTAGLESPDGARLLTAFAVVSGLGALGFGLRWLFELGRSTEQLKGRALQNRPAATVAWFFVPVANFFMPSRALRELESENAPDAEPSRLIYYWAAAWILVTAEFLSFAAAMFDPGVIGVAESVQMILLRAPAFNAVTVMWMVQLLLAAEMVAYIQRLHEQALDVRTPAISGFNEVAMKKTTKAA